MISGLEGTNAHQRTSRDYGRNLEAFSDNSVLPRVSRVVRTVMLVSCM